MSKEKERREFLWGILVVYYYLLQASTDQQSSDGWCTNSLAKTTLLSPSFELEYT